MADQFFDSSEKPAPGGNIAELSVGEISQAIKHTLEGAFGRVRVRGEVGRPNYHGSGHLYFTLKDSDAAMDAAFAALTDDAEGQEEEIPVMGRVVAVSSSAHTSNL